MQPRFVSKEAFTVVGMLIHTQLMTPEIPKLWEQFAWKRTQTHLSL